MSSTARELETNVCEILLKVIKLFDFNHRFKFQDYVHNGCHDLLMLSVNISDITIITVKNVDYHCIIHNIKSKSKAINLLKSAVHENFGYL